MRYVLQSGATVHEPRYEGAEDEPGGGYRQDRDDSTADVRPPDAAHGGRVDGRAPTPGGRGHVLRASHVNVALDWVPCAALSSLTA